MQQENQVVEIIRRLHEECMEIVKETMGDYLPVAGNIAIFCQSDEEHQKLSLLANEMVQPNDNPNQKYFKLWQPIIIPENNGAPESIYEYLYIRQPSGDSPERGDIDFVLSPDKYEDFKQQIESGKVKNASIYNRPGWDMVEIRQPGATSLPYITTQEMAEKVRVRF